MTEGKLECSCAEQMEFAALFSADPVGPWRTLWMREPRWQCITMRAQSWPHPGALKAIIDMSTCTPRHTLQLSQSWSREPMRPGSILFMCTDSLSCPNCFYSCWNLRAAFSSTFKAPFCISFTISSAGRTLSTSPTHVPA